MVIRKEPKELTPEGKITEKSQDISKESNEDHSMIIYIDMYSRGRVRSIESGDTEPNEDDLKSLEGQARASARQTASEEYDPKKYPHDKIRETEHQKNILDKKEAEKGKKIAETKVKEKETELAKREGKTQKPKQPTFILWGASITMAFSLVPTVHDSFFSTFKDDVLAWGISFLCSLFTGLFVSWSILGAIEETGEKTTLNWMGILSAILVPTGFAGLRMASVEDVYQFIFCLALTILEIGIVLLLERNAKNLREKYQEYTAEKKLHEKAQAGLSFALQDQHRWKGKVEVCEKARLAHLAYVEDKMTRFLNVSKLEENAVKSIREGYFDGLAYNRGKLYGNFNKENNDE